MRRLFYFCAAALALLLAHAAVAQPAPLPPGDARIVGRVLHRESGAPANDIEVVLYALREAGAPGIARTRSDDDGRFEFIQISNHPDISYLLGARYRELPYPGERVAFAPGAQIASAEIRIAELTTSREALRPAGVSLHVSREASGLRVEHSVRTTNTGERTFYRAKDERGRGAGAAFELTLPQGAREFEMPLGAVPEGVRRRGRRLAYFGPIHPGEHELAFRYLLRSKRARGAADTAPERFTLQVRAAKNTPLELLLPRGLGEVTAPRLTRAPVEHTHAPGEAHDPNEETFERWHSSAGGAFEITLALPPAQRDPNAVRVLTARALLHVDDAVLTVNENYTLEVTGSATQLADAAAPFLLVTLPPGAHNLHFGSDAPDVTLETHAPELPLPPDAPPLSEAELAQAWLAAVGSVRPGRFQVGARYQLAVGDDGAANFARRFAARLPAFSIFLVDSGDLEPTSARLHRRRPLREQDRNYLHLEAFEVRPGEVLDLRIGRRARAGAQRGPLALGAAALLALGAVLFLAAPLRARDAAALREPTESEAGRERAALIAAIHDLDHDYETGKLSAPDHAELRSELRARAIEALRREQQQSPAGHTGAAVAAERKAAGHTGADASNTGKVAGDARATAVGHSNEVAADARAAAGSAGAAADSIGAAAGSVGAAADSTEMATAGAREGAVPCPQCRAATNPAHRFCPACGVRLAPEASA